MSSFETMDLFGPLKQALSKAGYQQPTPIQAQTIPAAVDGRDILGCAQTGTGKTAAFALPILDYLGRDRPNRRAKQPISLVLAPTRELAIQIAESFKGYGGQMRFRLALVYGGVGQGAQTQALRGGVDVLVATPGRLLDLMDQGYIDLSGVEIFVLDEADRMLDMGFLPALKRIFAALPEERQSLFFSATLSPKIRQLAGGLLYDPVSVTVEPKQTSVAAIAQRIRFVNRDDKLESLSGLLDGADVERSIVFTRTKHGANSLAKKLDRAGIRATAIHGNKSQASRQRSLEDLRQNRVQVLVATDVAARGIDIDGITHVINYDMPVDSDSYVHRIGRTGRAGATGIAISFCTADELEELRSIEKRIGDNLRIENPGFEWSPSESISKRRDSSGRGSRGNRSGRSHAASSSGGRRGQRGKSTRALSAGRASRRTAAV